MISCRKRYLQIINLDSFSFPDSLIQYISISCLIQVVAASETLHMKYLYKSELILHSPGETIHGESFYKMKTSFFNVQSTLYLNFHVPHLLEIHFISIWVNKWWTEDIFFWIGISLRTFCVWKNVMLAAFTY